MICNCSAHCPSGTPPCACWCHARTVVEPSKRDGRIPPEIYETEGPPDPEGRVRQIVSEERDRAAWKEAGAGEVYREAMDESFCPQCAEQHPESKGKPNPTYLDGGCALHGRQKKRDGGMLLLILKAVGSAPVSQLREDLSAKARELSADGVAPAKIHAFFAEVHALTDADASSFVRQLVNPQFTKGYK